MRIGIISDTHGILHPYALELFRGVALIIHAGDIGQQEIINRLETVAPVRAVTGNVDWGSPLDRLYPKVLSFAVEGCQIYVKHVGGKPEEWHPTLPEPRPDVAICGHSHIGLIETYEGVLFINPGAAGRSRFGRGLNLAILTIESRRPHARLVALP